MQNSLFLSKTAIFLRKISGPSGFLHFRGVLPPCLYTQLALCAEKCGLLLSFGTSGPLKTKICDALMTKYFKKVLAWGQILQKCTYNARTKCANLKRSFSLLKGAFFLRDGLKCDIIPGRVRGYLKTASKIYFKKLLTLVH